MHSIRGGSKWERMIKAVTAGKGDKLTVYHLGLALWWAWAYVLFFSPSFFAGVGLRAESAPTDIWVTSCVGYVISMAVSMIVSKKAVPIISHKAVLVLSPVLTCCGTIIIAIAYHQDILDSWVVANAGGFATGIGTAWLSLAWGELFSEMGMEKTGRLVTLSLFLGIVLNYVLVSMPSVVCIPVTIILPAVSMLALQKSLKTRPIVSRNPSTENITPSIFPWKFIVNIGAMGLAFGFLKGVGLTSEVYDISPYMLFIGIAVMSFAFVFWTNVLHRNLNVSLVYRVAMFTLIVSFMLIPFLDGIAVGWASAAVTACYDCFDMVIWVIMANIVALTTTPAVRVFGAGRLSNHLGMLIGAVLGWFTGAYVHQIPPLQYFMPTLVVFVLVLCAFTTLKEADFFTTPLAALQRMSSMSKDVDIACARIAEQYGLTPREEEVMRFLGRGRNAAYIAETLVISENTVKSHAKHIYRKLNINTQQQLIDLIEEKVGLPLDR